MFVCLCVSVRLCVSVPRRCVEDCVGDRVDMCGWVWGVECAEVSMTVDVLTTRRCVDGSITTVCVSGFVCMCVYVCARVGVCVETC